MDEFKLKIILSVLSGIVFSFLFILLAFILPVKEKKKFVSDKKPSSRIEKISRSMQN